VKRLNRDLNELETEKQEWLLEREVNDKKSNKLKMQIKSLKDNQAKLQKEREELESLVLVGEDQIHQQVGGSSY